MSDGFRLPPEHDLSPQELFHRLWTKAVARKGEPDSNYDKSLWIALSKHIDRHFPVNRGMSVNLNTTVEVVLTTKGAEILNAHYEPTRASTNIPIWKEGDTYKRELWQVMHIFGPFTTMGFRDLPFEPNELTIVELR